VVKLVEHKDIISQQEGRDVFLIRGCLQTVEHGRRSYEEVMEAKGEVQERGDMSMSIMGKSGKQSLKAMDGFGRREAKTLSGDHAAQAGVDLLINVLECV
jgi:hypothetical protein